MKKALVLYSVVFALLCACSPRRIKSEMKAEDRADARLAKGRAVFKANCQKCHPNGEAGAGPSLNNVHLPGFMLRARIRSRAFLLYTGRMPAFDKTEISRKEQDDLIRYLKQLRKLEKY
jgi:mono/diheme cytochrome c family protein